MCDGVTSDDVTCPSDVRCWDIGRSRCQIPIVDSLHIFVKMENSDIFSSLKRKSIFSSLKRKSIFSSLKRKMASYSNSQADVVEIYTGDMKFPEDLSDGCGRSDASTQTSDRRSTDLSDGWSRSDVSTPRRSEDGDERDRSVTS